MDYKSKRNKILEDLKNDLARGRREEEVTVFGRKFKLHTLNEDEESWADTYIRPTSTMAMISTKKAPTLAVAITEINGQPVTTLFEYPDDMPQEVKTMLDSNPIQRAYWVRSQMLQFLLEDGNRNFIDALYNKYQDLVKARDEALAQIPN